jgi:hypothetical protein
MERKNGDNKSHGRYEHCIREAEWQFACIASLFAAGAT